MEKRRKREENEARKVKEEDDTMRLRQTFQEKKKNIGSLAGTKEILIEIQMTRKRKEEKKNEAS